MVLSATSRVRDWLLNSNIQIAEGPDHGAVAGWLDETGSPEFIYTEITGYYLTCMAFMELSGQESAKAIANAQLAMRWLYHQCRQGQVPPTRRYFSANGRDWRSNLLFAFDLAMTLRGVVAVEGWVPVNQHQLVKEVLIYNLTKFCGPGCSFSPFLRNDHDQVTNVPLRWSTTGGPYQTKIAASLLTSPALSLPTELEQACQRISSRWLGTSQGRITGERHADLYFLEGLLLFAFDQKDSNAMNLAAETYQTLTEWCGEEGYFSLERSRSGSALRSDVAAQLLRAGCILKSSGYYRQESVWAERLRQLAELLRHFMSFNGAVSFALPNGTSHVHWNAWCALFAYQALSFFDVVSRGESLDDRWVRLLI